MSAPRNRMASRALNARVLPSTSFFACSMKRTHISTNAPTVPPRWSTEAAGRWPTDDGRGLASPIQKLGRSRSNRRPTEVSFRIFCRSRRKLTLGTCALRERRERVNPAREGWAGPDAIFRTRPRFASFQRRNNTKCLPRLLMIHSRSIAQAFGRKVS